MWHSVISASGIKVRYNPSSQEFRLMCAKHVLIRLTELSDFYAIQVLLLQRKANSHYKLNPPNPPRPEWISLSGRNLTPLNPKEGVQHPLRAESP